MEETPHPDVPPVDEETELPVSPPAQHAPSARPAPAPSVPRPGPLHPQLKSLLSEMLHAICAIAERVDADHEGVKTAISTLRNVHRHIEEL